MTLFCVYFIFIPTHIPVLSLFSKKSAIILTTMMGRRCRVWWPKQLSLRKPSSSSSFLLGWFVSSSPSSLDVVVAFAYTEFALSGLQSSLQGILRDTNGRMPVLLQDKSMVCVVGQIFKDLIEEDQSHSSSCGCHELSGSVEQCRDNFEGNGYWIQMLCDPKEQVGKDIAWIPKLHHVHWNGKIVSRCDVHVSNTICDSYLCCPPFLITSLEFV